MLDSATQVQVSGDSLLSVIIFEEENGASGEASNAKSLGQGVFVSLAIERGADNFAVDKQVQARAGIGGNVVCIDGIEVNIVSVPIVGVLGHTQ